MSRKDKLKKFLPGCMGRPIHFLWAILILIFFVILLNQKPWLGFHIDQYSGTKNHTEASWEYSIDSRVLDDDISLPYYSKLEAGKTYSISAPLSYDGRNDVSPFAFFYCHHMYCRVYLDGEEIFNYTPETIQRNDKARSPGNIYASVPLPRDCLGKEFRIEFIPALNINQAYELPNVLFGDYPSIVYTTFHRNIVQNIITLIAFFLGAASVLVSTLLLSGADYREGIFIGIFAMLFAAYNLTECHFNFYLISNPYYIYLLNYTAFALAPVALMAFLREKFSKWRKTSCTVMIFTGLFIVCLQAWLHFTGLVDMREFLSVLHIEYLIDFILIFIMLTSMKHTDRKRVLILQLVPIIVGILIDGFNYYKRIDILDSDAPFATIGVIIFLIVEIHHVWRSSNRIYIESIMSREYQQMAFVDSLTGIGNRRAYEAERDSVLSSEKKYSSLIVASLDINNLKTVNDNIGHAAGDYLIRSAANIVCDLVGKSGSVFRMGGDEFTALIYDLDEKEFLARINDTSEKISEFNSNSEVKLSMAIGYAFVNECDIDQALSDADKKMYINKSLKKKDLQSSPHN